MLFCCLWRNVETSCHKHFVVVSRHQQTPPLTTSGKCHNLPRSGGTMLITPGWPHRWQHTNPDTDSESRFMPTPLAFDVRVRGIPVMTFGVEKLEWCGYPIVKKIWRYVYLFRQNVRTWQTDRQTDGQTPHKGIGPACIVSRGEN